MKKRLQWFGLAAIVLLGLLFISGCSKRKAAAVADSPYQAAIKSIGGRNYEEAFQKLDEAIVADRHDGRDSALAEDYLLRGYLCRLTGLYDSVTVAYQQAIAIGHALGDNHFERRGKIGLAEYYVDAAMYALAEPEASGAVTLGVLQSDPGSVYQSLLLDAKALHGLTRYKAEELVIDSMSRLDTTALQNAHGNEIAEQRFIMYRDAGNDMMLRQAMSSWIATAAVNHDTSATILATLLWASTLHDMNKPDSSARAYADVLTLAGFAGDSGSQIECLSRLGNIALESGRMENALRYYREALTQSTAAGNIFMEEMLRLQLVACDWLGRKSSARDSSRTDLEIDRIRAQYEVADSNVGISSTEGYALFLRGRMQERRNQPATALKSYGTALDQFERDGVLQDRHSLPAGLAAAFQKADGSGWYDTPLSLHCAVLDGAGAVRLAERRNLADYQFFFSNLVPAVQGPAGGAIAALQQDIHARRLAQRDLYEDAMLASGRNKERMFRILTAGYGGTNDSLSVPAGLPPVWQPLLGLSPFDVRRIQDSIPASAAVVEFAPAASYLNILVIRRDTVLIRSSAMDRVRLGSLMAEYRHLVTLSDSVARISGIAAMENRVTTLSAILGTAFLAPIKSALAGVTTLYVVQAPELEWLPVHTLLHGEMASKYTFKYLPFADAMLGQVAPQPPNLHIAGFGYRGANTWDVEYELKDIWSFYREAKMFFDTAATAKVLAESPFDLIHLCTDFQLNAAAPGESHMVIADPATSTAGMPYPAGNFYGAMRPTSTVIFSNIADQPGGLSRYIPALILANGTSTLIGTLWQGDRKAKKYFGEIFYTTLLTGVPAAEAYHQAMVKMTVNPEYASPRLYGTYFLFGK